MEETFYCRKPLHAPPNMCGSSNMLALALHTPIIFQLKSHYFKRELYHYTQSKSQSTTKPWLKDPNTSYYNELNVFASNVAFVILLCIKKYLIPTQDHGFETSLA